MDDKWFRARLKTVGKNAGDIAQAAGRSRSNVSHILNGHQRMSLEWAQVFAKVLESPVATILERAGVADKPLATELTAGFADSDAAPFVYGPGMAEGPAHRAIAAALGGRAGVDVWRVKSRAMALSGLLEGDFMLVDTHQAERVRSGDVVIAQIYSPRGATTILRRFEPPVLVAASADPDEGRVHVVDGNNVVIRGKVISSWRST